MILPNHAIAALSAGNGSDLISPYNPKHLRDSSYDLTVGAEYYIGKSEGATPLETQHLRSNQSFTIPPHAVCFILTAEIIHLPADVTAKVSLRMTHIYAGVVLTSQPPFDPGYEGKVVIMLHNLSSAPVHLKSGERVATVEFLRLESPPSNPKAHRSVRTLEEQLDKPLISSLSEIANLSKSAQDKVTWLSGQMLGFAALIVAVLAVPGFFSYSGLLDRLGEQRDQIKEMGNTLEAYKRELQKYNVETEVLKKQLSALESSQIIAKGDTPPQLLINGVKN